MRAALLTTVSGVWHPSVMTESQVASSIIVTGEARPLVPAVLVRQRVRLVTAQEEVVHLATTVMQPEADFISVLVE